MPWDDTSLLYKDGDLLPAGWVRPSYSGRGYANIPATVATSRPERRAGKSRIQSS